MKLHQFARLTRMVKLPYSIKKYKDEYDKK